ncbi:MAG: hypothetical protein RML37_06420 [Chitinophagales bacterium]|nr:hypothetical protein [Chitinophagales bacterium]
MYKPARNQQLMCVDNKLDTWGCVGYVVAGDLTSHRCDFALVGVITTALPMRHQQVKERWKPAVYSKDYRWPSARF